jgi:hypothetical protein
MTPPFFGSINYMNGSEAICLFLLMQMGTIGNKFKSVAKELEFGSSLCKGLQILKTES